VIDVSQPNEMTNVATKLKNVKLHPSYKQFQLKASPCPGIDTVRNFAYIGVCCMTLTNGGTVLQQQKMTIAKVPFFITRTHTINNTTTHAKC
jgi:glutaredoxin-related protein